jgi:Zn-finger nucleic acid-binding protein
MIDRDLYNDFEQSRVYPDTVPEPTHPEEPVLMMVGMGAPCDLNPVPVPMVCPKCKNEMEVSGTTCGHVECPKCWGTWARRGAERVAARVWGYQEAAKTHHKPRHATFDLDSVDWKEAKKKCAALGFTGGVMIIHPWRIKDEFRGQMEIMAERTGKSRYEIVRESAIGMDAMRYSPHAHVICYGKGVQVEKGSDEYKYRMIRRLNSLDGVQGAVYYLLSHTFIPEGKGRTTYRYFGTCLPQRLKPTFEGKASDALRCPNCQTEMVYPGTNICKEISKYYAMLWKIVVPKKRLRPATPALAGAADHPAPQGHPSFYYAGTFPTNGLV